MFGNYFYQFVSQYSKKCIIEVVDKISKIMSPKFELIINLKMGNSEYVELKVRLKISKYQGRKLFMWSKFHIFKILADNRSQQLPPILFFQYRKAQSKICFFYNFFTQNFFRPIFSYTKLFTILYTKVLAFFHTKKFAFFLHQTLKFSQKILKK